MATALINGQESIISQIHTSWNEFRSTDEAMVLMFGEVGSNYRDYHEIPLAKDFAKSDTPWTTKETVLEKNAVHANNLIRYYIGLNIDVAERMHIWQFFEIGTGIVGKIKEQDVNAIDSVLDGYGIGGDSAQLIRDMIRRASTSLKIR